LSNNRPDCPQCGYTYDDAQERCKRRHCAYRAVECGPSPLSSQMSPMEEIYTSVTNHSRLTTINLSIMSLSRLCPQVPEVAARRQLLQGLTGSYENISWANASAWNPNPGHGMPNPLAKTSTATSAFVWEGLELSMSTIRARYEFDWRTPIGSGGYGKVYKVYPFCIDYNSLKALDRTTQQVTTFSTFLY